MVTMLKQLLSTWTSERNQRLKMQQAYFTLVIILAFVSGMVTLVNVSLGRTIVMVAALIALVYIINALSWAVFDMIISRKIEQRQKTSAIKKR